MKPSFFQLISIRLRGKYFVYELYFKGKKTLDIGCGEGEFLKNDAHTITGVEPNAEAVRRLQSRGYVAVEGKLPKLPFEDSSFDGIHCRNVIEHLDVATAYSLFTEASRLLKRGGVLVVGSDMVSDYFWDTFGHVKPYPPAAILRLFLSESREEFTPITGLAHRATVYLGRYSKNKLLYFLRCAAAWYLPSFRDEYLLVLQKT